MARKAMSPEAKKRISEAAKRRWAEYRKAKASGMPVPARKSVGRPAKTGWTPAKRAAQSRKIRAALARRRGGAVSMSAPSGEFGGMAIEQLVAMRRRIDQELADRLVRGQG